MVWDVCPFRTCRALGRREAVEFLIAGYFEIFLGLSRSAINFSN
jgi:hypothetical protein